MCVNSYSYLGLHQFQILPTLQVPSTAVTSTSTDTDTQNSIESVVIISLETLICTYPDLYFDLSLVIIGTCTVDFTILKKPNKSCESFRELSN